MKTAIIQPPYSLNPSDADACFAWEMAAMDRCDGTLDLVVLPETCDVPAYTNDPETYFAMAEKYGGALLEKASETAKRCGATLFINVNRPHESGYVNTTVCFDKTGKECGEYRKAHPTNGEVYRFCKDARYSYEPHTPTLLTVDGVTYAFLTCYDFYFYESFANIARFDPDIIIGCSHQRSDKQSALKTMCQFLAYNTNAYVVRASVSMGEDTDIGGGSMIVAPDGTVLVDLASRAASGCAEFDPKKKFTKAAGYGNPPAMHHEYIETGRRPWLYRPAGQAIKPFDDVMLYPRICAHRGFSTVAPENSMAAFGAAYALGADEIEFDLWPTKDGHIVTAHDPTLERVSDGSGNIYEKTLDELKKVDFGCKRGAAFAGLSVVTFEEILQKFAGHLVMNVHIKTLSNGEDGSFAPFTEETLGKVIDLIRRYDCARRVYFMTGNPVLLGKLLEMAPDIARAAGYGGHAENMIPNAVKYKCRKIQLFKPYFDKAMIDEAHAKGILCTCFFADDPDEAARYLDMGVDTILTNDFNRVCQALKHRLHTYRDPWIETHYKR